VDCGLWKLNRLGGTREQGGKGILNQEEGFQRRN